MRDVKRRAPASWTKERFAPEARLIRLPTWRVNADGSGDLWHEKAQVWRRIDAIFVDALETLKEGRTFEEGYERALRRQTEQLRPNHIRAWLRRFWYELHRSGYIEIPFEPAPELYAGRYRHLRELGRGGVGIANLCADEKEAGRLVVVKHAWGYLHRTHQTDKGMRNEGRTLKAFDHSGIVRFFDEFEERDLYHLVREFADGEPLPDACKDGIEPERRRRIARQVADMLRHVHEREHVFLDVTPKQFVLRADGSPLAVDVGLCRPHDGGIASLRAPVGSRGYAAPEVIARKGATLATDVFGFGCLYYYLCVGSTPAHMVTAEQRVADLRRKGGADEDAALVARLTADDPKERPQDMDAVLALL